MKRRYFSWPGKDEYQAEVALFDLIPDSAVEEANAWLDINEPNLKQREIKDRELIVRAHDRFEICVETHSDYRNYEFCYNPLTGEVRYIRMEGDFKS